MSLITRVLTYEDIPVWRHTLVIQWVLQIVSAILVVALVVWLFTNMSLTIEDRNIPFGFDFLDREYQTPIGEHFIPYESSDTFRYALIVAVTNTLLVSVLGVVLATLLGTAIGIARLSNNWIVSMLALAYVELFRNVPLLVQLLFWLFIVLALPAVREGYVIADLVYINNGGLSFPGPSGIGGTGVALAWLALAAMSVVTAVLVHRRLTKHEVSTGRPSHPLLAAVLTVVASAAIFWVVLSVVFGNTPFVVGSPEPEGLFGRIGGGLTMRAGLLVVLLGLVVYTAAFIAEIVRAGIQSVGRGQVEAARALGLSPMSSLRNVVLPQALRVIVPPIISQYLNLTKNSSLGGAVGYTELTNVGITMTQTAPAISIFLLIMIAYLAMSLVYSLVGNLYNRHISFGRR